MHFSLHLSTKNFIKYLYEQKCDINSYCRQFIVEIIQTFAWSVASILKGTILLTYLVLNKKL